MSENGNLFVSTSCFKKKSIIDIVGDLSKITLNIELSGGSQYEPHLLDKLVKLKKEKGFNFLVHSYFPSPEKHFILNFADTSVQTRKFVSTAVGYVKLLDIDYYSIHAGLKRDFKLKDELLYEPSGEHYFLHDIYQNEMWFRKEFPGIKLAVENSYPNNLNTETAFLTHIDEIVEYLESGVNTYLLLDLGHLKVSSRILDFNYIDAVELIFEKYIDRVLEIHLSENQGKSDKHEIVYSDSIQYLLMRDYSDLIREKNINVTIEARNYSIENILESFTLLSKVLNK